jgi:Acyl-CoA dehydrogenase, C-terminal domain
MEITTDAVQLLGGYGYIEDFPVERMMRDAKITHIYKGTNRQRSERLYSTQEVSLGTAGLGRAELIAFGVLHDPPVSCRSLIDLAYAGCTHLLQPGNQLIEAPGLTVDVDVQAVFAGLPLRNFLEQQPPTASDAAGLVERILWVSYRGVAAKGSAAAVLNDRIRVDVACG